MCTPSFKLFAARAVLVVAVVAGGRQVSAVDDQADFVEALRSRGYHDLALEYLEGAEKRGLTTPEFRKRLSYERVITRLDQVRTIKDADAREQALQTASDDLAKFTRSSQDKGLAAEAAGRLAAAYVNFGKLQLVRAAPLRGGPGASAAEPLLESARRQLEEAREQYTTAAQLYEEELEGYQNADADSPEAKRRLQLRGALAQMRLLGGRVLHQQADTHEPGSRSFKSLNKQAAEELGAFYEKYSRWLVGLYAHLFEGQAYLALKEYESASDCFKDLIVQPDSDPTFRRLITLAHASLAETRIAQGELEDALDDGVEWFDGLRSNEDDGPEAMTLAFQLGRAALMQAEAADKSDQRRLLGRSRQWLRDASRVSSEFQLQARQALASVNDLLGASESLNSFDDAYQAVKDAVTSLSASKQAVKIAKRNNPEVAEELEAEIEDSRRQALAAIKAAMSLTEDTTPLAQLNEVRSSYAFLLWDSGQFLRAAVVGEFLATQHPGDPSAAQAAKLAIASLQQLYQTARESGDDGGFETDRLANLTEAVVKTWPGTDTASAAAGVLVGLFLRDNRLDDARRVIGEVDAAGRPALELQLATAVWEQALRRVAEAPDGKRRRVDREKSSAADMLEAAFSQSRDRRPVSPQLATAALYLTQARLDSGDAKQAVSLLEDKEVGPLTLLDRGASAVSRSGYAAEAYKLAMRAYVSLNPPKTDEALRIMADLERAIRKDGGGKAAQQQKLTRVYLGLGVQLQQQIADLNSRGQAKKARTLSDAFASFVDNLEKQSKDADWVTRQWIGQTYLKLAETYGVGKKANASRAKARDVFAAMIESAQKSPGYAPKPTSVLAARLLLGDAYRKLGEYQPALDVYSSILVEREMTLEAQKAAAYTLQEWGAATDTSQLTNAIRGSRLDPETKKNVVWGWSKLGKVAASVSRKRPEFKDLFFESWLNIAMCRYLAAEKSSGSERDKQLASARRTLQGMVRQYPELGGDDRRAQFDKLAKQIQKLEGGDPVGLEEFGA
ncbi:MAG: hypothetical protein AAF596_03355 [Planctomycetota bacterium]